MNTKTDPQAQPQAVLSSAELGPKPAAWRYQQATYGVGDVRGREWLPALKFTKPGWECMQKDVEPLYDQAALDAARKQGWDECMALWADHMKRMNAAITKPLPDGWANHAHHLAQNVREALKAAPTEAKAPNTQAERQP